MGILKTPLSQETVAVLVAMGVQMFSDYRYGALYIHRRYWNRTSEPMRQAIIRIVEAMEAKTSEVASA